MGSQVHHISRESGTEVTVSETEKLQFFNYTMDVFKKKKKVTPWMLLYG